ncbi:MAG: 30S ribosomal protein S9, partial [Chlamydiia bacterium]|nr:30S ribosomal protein S9 [Chlamydiia bacterium]
MTVKEEFLGTGRRKSAVAAVRLRPGTGVIDINGRGFEEYFPVEMQRLLALAPLSALDLSGKYDIIIRCKGGGVEGQACAVKLGIARALVQEDLERRTLLKKAGYLKRDPRRRERKKFGLRGARRAYQFSKR